MSQELLVGILLAITSAVFVYKDAEQRGVESRTLWAIGAFMAWIIFVPLYCYKHMLKHSKS